MSGMGCLAAMADGLLAVSAYFAEVIARRLGIEDRAAGWVLSFVLASVAVVSVIALVMVLR